MQKMSALRSATILEPANSGADYRGTVMLNREVFVRAKVTGDGNQPQSVKAGTSGAFPAYATQDLTRQGSSDIWSGWVSVMVPTYYVRVEATFTNIMTLMMEFQGANDGPFTDPG